MSIINLTPHKIIIKTENGDMSVHPSGTVARVATTEKQIGQFRGAPVVIRSFGEVQNLPDPKDGVVYLVSSIVLAAVSDRVDVVAPDTGPTAIRDDEGQIKAVTQLIATGERNDP